MTELTERPNVETFIGNHLETLESVLDERAQRYFKVWEEKDSYDFGQNLTPDRLRELVGEVIQDTKDFLEVKEAPPVYLNMFHLPRDIKIGAKVGLVFSTIGALAQISDGFSYSDLQVAGLVGGLYGIASVLVMKGGYLNSSYRSKEREIRIGEKKEVEAAGVVAHEYTHHLQNSFTSLKSGSKDPIVEGHATGVDGTVADIFAQRYDNPAYTFRHTVWVARELKDAYLFICEEKGITPRESLANLKIPKIRGPLSRFTRNSRLHHYSIGVAAMSIAEVEHGEEVYRDVMKNDFSFLEVRK